MSAHEWDQVKARARRILRSSRDRKTIRERTRKRNTDLLGVISERREIFSSPRGLPRPLKRSTATDLRVCDMVSLVPATPLGEKSSTLIGDLDGLFCGVQEGSNMGMSLRRSLREKTEWSAASPAPATALMGEEPSVGASIGGGLFSAKEWEFFRAQSRRFLRRAQRREDCLLRSRIRAHQMIFDTDTVLRDMDIRGEVEVRSMKMLQETVESGGGVSVPALQMDASVVGLASPRASGEATESRSPATHGCLGKMAARRTRGDCSPLIIDMEAARKAVRGFMVVGRLLSPFHVNPHSIVDELRATAWKSQVVITVQEVASEDGRFVLNFMAEGDRRFVLKAQPWHYRRDGVIFVEFDGEGDPAEVDLGVMAIGPRFNANKNATQNLRGKKGKKDRKYREVNKGGEV
ncbi:hypothetical protein ZWY2020_037923 [Hordeum vulgare]|nr:hypothetical protein ZWY2020_037923 [Hordeum vulgare]